MYKKRTEREIRQKFSNMDEAMVDDAIEYLKQAHIVSKVYNVSIPSLPLSGEKIAAPYTVTQDITLYAKWLPTYLVTFETNGGSEIASFKTRTIENVQQPEKPGFTFIEWYLDSSLNTKAVFPLTITKDTKKYQKT